MGVVYIFHQFLQQAFRDVSGDRLPRLKAYATINSATAPKLKRQSRDQNYAPSGGTFYAWLVLGNVYQRTKFEALRGHSRSLKISIPLQI